MNAPPRGRRRPLPTTAIPHRWWTEGEVREILARRAVLDHVGLVPTDQRGGERWECCYSVDGGRVGLRAAVSRSTDLPPDAGTIAVVPPPPGTDLATITLRPGDAGTIVYALRVSAGPYGREIELVLPSSWYADRPPHPDVAASLVRLHALLWE